MKSRTGATPARVGNGPAPRWRSSLPRPSGQGWVRQHARGEVGGRAPPLASGSAAPEHHQVVGRHGLDHGLREATLSASAPTASRSRTPQAGSRAPGIASKATLLGAGRRPSRLKGP